jgi:mannose-1-phosphate guanylyltransferase
MSDVNGLTKTDAHFYVLIMAGGGGTRLWPLSRKSRPKQALALTEERTLFQVTVERLNGLISPERIFVVANPELSAMLHESTPTVPAENFIVEPSGRDSGPAAGLGIATIAKKDPQAVVAILSADHHIANVERFLAALRTASDYARRGFIVTLGIHPTHPATSFGYIQRSDLIGVDAQSELKVYRSRRFTEKPDETTAAAFISSGMYSWNAGIFILNVAQGLAEFARQQPEMHAALQQIAERPDQIDVYWNTIKKISLDYAIMEDAQNVAVIPVDIGWSDVGTWSTLFEVLSRDEQNNASQGKFKDHICIDSEGMLIVSDKIVVTIGVSDLVIVDTPDAVLVCHRDRAQDVKEVVNRLKEIKQDLL